MNRRNSRSRSQDRRGPRRSPQRHERGNYRRRSPSRSDSRGRDMRRAAGGTNNNYGNDAGRRRTKFSEPGGSGGGFQNGYNNEPHYQGGRGGYHDGNNGHMYEMASVPGHGGFQNENPAFNYGNQRNYQPQYQYEDIGRHGGPPPPPPQHSQHNGFQVPFQNKPPPAENHNFDPSLIQIMPLRQGGQKVQRKVFIPQDGKFNYIGLIIGPKGANQKQLEEDTQCKILIRGKDSQKQGMPPLPDDNEELHVLIEADNEINANKAMREIENIILMDEEEKVKRRDSQLRTSSVNSSVGSFPRPSEFQPDPEKLNFIVVPNNCVGLVIGRKGETIKQIRERSGAERVYMQSEANRNFNDDTQKLIVEGSPEAVEKVREIIEDIKNQSRRKPGGGGVMNGGTSAGEARIEMEIPPNMAGLVIGKQGSTLQQVAQQTRTHCSMQQNNNNPSDDGKKILIITGATEEDCLQAKAIFQEKINSKSGGGGMQSQNGPRFQGPAPGGAYGSIPPRPMGGRPPPFPGRRPRRNADGDEIIDDANQYEYYGGYETDMMMQNQMYANMYMGMQMPFGQFPIPPTPEASQNAYAQQGAQNGQIASTEQQAAQEANPELANQAQYQMGQYDPMQMQMQMQYQQQLYYQQMQQMQGAVPQIQEVLADGTIVSAAQDDDDRKGKRGGRR